MSCRCGCGCCGPHGTAPCDCCVGIERLTPLPIVNRAGLDHLTYRVGTWATFFETMRARLTTQEIEEEGAS